MTRRQKLAWAAGFFDGEGCITVAKKYIKRKYYYSLTLGIGGNDKKNIYRFARYAGFGEVYFEERWMYDHRFFIFKLGKVDDIKKLLLLMKPYLVGKQLEAEIVLKYWIKRDRKRGRLVYQMLKNIRIEKCSRPGK